MVVVHSSRPAARPVGRPNSLRILRRLYLSWSRYAKRCRGLAVCRSMARNLSLQREQNAPDTIGPAPLIDVFLFIDWISAAPDDAIPSACLCRPSLLYRQQKNPCGLRGSQKVQFPLFALPVAVWCERAPAKPATSSVCQIHSLPRQQEQL